MAGKASKSTKKGGKRTPPQPKNISKLPPGLRAYWEKRRKGK